MPNILNAVSEKHKLRINITQTKVKFIDRANNNRKCSQNIAGYKMMDNSSCLKSAISDEGNCKQNIRRWIEKLPSSQNVKKRKHNKNNWDQSRTNSCSVRDTNSFIILSSPDDASLAKHVSSKNFSTLSVCRQNCSCYEWYIEGFNTNSLLGSLKSCSVGKVCFQYLGQPKEHTHQKLDFICIH